jgi:hypothetical protein
MYSFVVIDGFKYAVMQGTYIRKWVRSYTSDLAAGLLRINFVDQGPGLQIYTFSLILANWAPTSLCYQNGITQTALQQMANLEATYLKIATPVTYIDPFGNPPAENTGTFMTNLNQIIPNYATTNKVYIQADIELTEGAGILIT